MRSFGFLSSLFCLALVGCSSRSNSIVPTAAPATVNISVHAGVYVSVYNSHGLGMILLVGSDGSIVGNSYGASSSTGNGVDNVNDLEAILAAGWKPGAGNYTGSIVGAIAYTDPKAARHTNDLAMTLTWTAKGATQPDPNFPSTDGTAYFGSDGTLDEAAANPAAIPAQWSGQWKPSK